MGNELIDNAARAVSKWDALKGQMFGVADGVKAKFNPNADANADASVETPGEKLMKEATSIDVTSSDEDDLEEAQREADEAEAELAAAEEEAAKWEAELAQLEAASAADEPDENALSSMGEAYQAALDAANENVDLLSSQIEALESELSATLARVESSTEEKERVGGRVRVFGAGLREFEKSRGGRRCRGGAVGGGD